MFIRYIFMIRRSFMRELSQGITLLLTLLFIGTTIANDKVKLLKELSDACKAGDIRACVKKGVLEKNIKVKMDCDKATDDDCFALAPMEMPSAKEEIQVLINACEASLWAKCYNLALKYEENGKLKEAKKYYRLSCKHDVWEGCYNLAFHLHKAGKIEEAMKFYTKACSGDFYAACYNQGVLEYEKKNYPKAKELFKKACDQEVAAACKALNKMKK